jgi:hypothetical protein
LKPQTKKLRAVIELSQGGVSLKRIIFIRIGIYVKKAFRISVLEKENEKN